MIEKLIKIILAFLLLLCLMDMPYGYYQLVRFCSFLGFAFLSYNANQKGNQNVMIIYAGLAILFQPFLKIALGRELWNFVDIMVGVGLLVSLLIKKR
jgi:hypothetical protein